MKHPTHVLLLLLSLFLPSAEAWSAEEDDLADIQCIAVSFKLMDQEGDQLRAAGMMSFLYYLGRLDGRSPKADIEAMLADAATTMSAEDISREAMRCGAELRARSSQLQQISESLIQRGQEMPDKPTVPEGSGS